MTSRAPTAPAELPPWLEIRACIGLAVAVAFAGLAAMKLVPPAPSNERTHAYYQWLDHYKAVERLCGEWTPKSAECWSRNPVPTQPRAK